MPIVKFLAKRQISRQLFKVCRLNKLETRSQVEAYFLEHRDFKGLKWCGSQEVEELERFIDADLLRLEIEWELPRELLQSKSVVQLADLLLQKQLFPGTRMEVFRSSLRIYRGVPPRSLVEMALELETQEKRLYIGRNSSVKKLLKYLQSLRALDEDLLGDYGLDGTSNLIIIDDARAQQINAKAGTNFSPQFLSLLFGIQLEPQFVLLGTPIEVLAGNFLGNRHYWSGFYLLKKELAEAFDITALLQEAFRLLHTDDGEIRSLNFRNFVSYFARKTAPLESLVPVAGEILCRELGLRVGKDGQLKFPARKELLFRSYCYEALEALGKATIAVEIRLKMNELHPEVFMDPYAFDSVMLDKYGFTQYRQQYYGLKKWYQESKGSLKGQDPELLESLRQKYSRSSIRAEKWQALMDFVNTHSRLPRRSVHEEEERLWNFWKSQLNRASQGNYYPAHQEQLNELERRFRSKKKYKPLLDWDERYARVKAFTEAKGIPPQRAATGEEKIFNNWLREQRQRMRKGHLDQRQEVLIKHYDELFPYKNKKYYELIWDKRFKDLEEFGKIHSRAPREHFRDEYSLECWYSNQRFQMSKGELTRRQHKLIQGFIDQYPLHGLEYRKGRWHERCTELEQFAEAHSHLPRCSVEKELSLNTWFTRQKLYGTQGKLDAEQLARLQWLSDNFEVPGKREQHFYERLEELKDFIRLHSRLPLGRGPEEESIYMWFRAQLRRAEAGILKPAQRDQLLKLRDQYGTRKPSWMERFRALRTFAETHSRLPKFTAFSEEEKNLYAWIRSQKARMKKGHLQEREEKLFEYLLTRYGKRKVDNK